VLVQDRCMVCVKCTIGSENILDAPNVLQGDESQVDPHFILFRIVLILTQDRCTICAERTIGLEIIMDAPNGTPS
jgi:hypothetical protein